MERYADKGLAVVGINRENRTEGEAEFARSKGFNYPVLLGAKPVFEMYGTRGMPTNVLIDREGIVRDREINAYVEWGNFERRIEALVMARTGGSPGPTPR